MELVDSEENERVWKILVHTWLLHYCCIFDFWILAAMRCVEEGYKESKLVELCLALCGCPVRDCSVQKILMSQEKTQIEECKDISKLLDENDAIGAWRQVEKGREKGVDYWSFLKLKKLQKWSLEDWKLTLCGAIVWECGCRKNIEGKWEKWIVINRVEIARWMQELAGLRGRRSRRLFEIPSEILYGIAGRGLTAEDTRWKLQGDPLLWARDCGWWAKEIERCGVGVDRVKDEDYEERLDRWWSTHFAIEDDIPDEWGLDEIHKSHGKGCGTDVFNTGRIWRLWFDDQEARIYDPRGSKIASIK